MNIFSKIVPNRPFLLAIEHESTIALMHVQLFILYARTVRLMLRNYRDGTHFPGPKSKLNKERSCSRENCLYGVLYIIFIPRTSFYISKLKRGNLKSQIQLTKYDIYQNSFSILMFVIKSHSSMEVINNAPNQTS